MAVSFRQSYVSRPSVPPTSSTSGGTLFVAHRRINQLGQRSEISPIREEVVLPATLTPQSYSDTDALLRDEFIVSTDGLSWKIIPSDVDHTGALSAPAYSASWVDTTISQNQAATGFTLDFADFSPSSEPSQTFYLLNIGTNIASLTYNFLDLITNSVASQYAGLIEVSILGTYSALGNNPDTSFNQSLLWDLPQVSLNTMSVLLPSLSYLKIKIKMLNFPLGNLSQQAFNLSLSVVSNQTTFTLTYPNQWPTGAFLIDEDSPFELPIIETTADPLTVQVNPFMFNQGNVLKSNLFVRTLEIDATGDYVLVFDATNTLKVETSSYILATGETEIGSFTLNGTMPYITDVFYGWPIKPQSYLKIGSSSILDRARFVTWSSGLAYAITPGTELGVSLYDESNLVATSGLCFIELGATVTEGQILGASTDGVAIVAAGPLIALEGGDSGDFIKAGFIA